MGGQEGSRKNQLGKCFPNHLAFFDSYYRRRFFVWGGGRSLSAPVWCLPGGQAGEIGKDTHTHTHSHITDSQSRLPFPQAKVLEANKWKQGERKGKVPLPFNLRHLI